MVALVTISTSVAEITDPRAIHILCCLSLILIYNVSKRSLKVALQILGRKFYKNTKKSSLYSQSLLIFIHKILVVEKHPTKWEIRDLLLPRSTPTGIMVYFFYEKLAHLHTANTQKKVSNIACNEDIMGNNYMLVMLRIQASFVTSFSHNAFFYFWCKI